MFALRFSIRTTFGCRRFDLLFPPALFLRANFLHSPALGCLDGQHRPWAFRAGFRHRRIPSGIIAIRIGVATVKQLAVARLPLNQMPFAALRARHAGILGRLERLDMFAFGIIGTADKFAIAAFFIY